MPGKNLNSQVTSSNIISLKMLLVSLFGFLYPINAETAVPIEPFFFGNSLDPLDPREGLWAVKVEEFGPDKDVDNHYF